MSGFLLGLFITLFILVCLILILLVLIQKGRGGGLASAFGGAGGNTAFGSKTGDVLTWATSVVFGVFLLLAIILNLLTRDSSSTTAQSPIAPLLPQVPSMPVEPGADPSAGDVPVEQ